MISDELPNYERIWLIPFSGGGGQHTWATNPEQDDAIEYVRSDLADPKRIEVDIGAALAALQASPELAEMMNEALNGALAAKPGMVSEEVDGAVELTGDDLSAIQEFAAKRSNYRTGSLAEKLFVRAVTDGINAWIAEYGVTSRALTPTKSEKEEGV